VVYQVRISRVEPIVALSSNTGSMCSRFCFSNEPEQMLDDLVDFSANRIRFRSGLLVIQGRGYWPSLSDSKNCSTSRIS